MIMINTGEGKGKTTAAVGQTLRALGTGKPVSFCQFMKRLGVGGEQEMLAKLLGDEFTAMGAGFYRGSDKDKHLKACEQALAWCRDRLDQRVFLLVMDEVLYALGHGLVLDEELLSLLDLADENGVHVLLTGRGVPGWLHERADLVTEMKAIKHPYDQGVQAMEGIEF